MGPGWREEFVSLLRDADAGEFGAGGDGVCRGPPRTGGFVDCDKEPLHVRKRWPQVRRPRWLEWGSQVDVTWL